MSTEVLVPIPIVTLQSNVALAFDIYLKISGKHLLYLKREDNLEQERFNRLVEKNVKEVFILEKDLKSYHEFLRNLSKAVSEQKTLPQEQRSGIITENSKAALTEMFANPEKKENYSNAQDAANFQAAFLLREPEALESMLKIAAHDKTIYQHSVNVATIAIGLANDLKASKEVCSAVGLGALLHDIGKVSPELSGQDADEAELRQHPRLGAGLLSNKKYVSRDVLDIIVLHEERVDGKGYPAGMKKLDQIFQVVGLANFYDKMVTFENKTPNQAFNAIKKIDPAPYDARLIQGLEKVLKANKILE